jgi:hypothetical protein
VKNVAPVPGISIQLLQFTRYRDNDWGY